MTLTSGSLFSGYGGLDLAIEAAFGARTVWHSEIDPAASRVLETRWPGVPNHGDIIAIDWTVVEPVDVLAGGFPCQDVSHAGKRGGLRPDTRSGLWSQMAYAINQLRPAYVVAENVRGLLSAEAHSDMEPCPWCLGDAGGESALRALGAVLGDLAELGYDSRVCGLRAADVGAPHRRSRVFVLAQDTNLATRGERWIAAPGQTEGGRAWADTGRRDRAPAADTDLTGSQGPQPARRRDLPDGRTAADTTGDGRHEGRAEPTRQFGRPDAAERRATTADTTSSTRRATQPEHLGTRSDGTAELGERTSADWGPYEPAIRRWEHTLGRVAPAPTEPGPRGAPRLSPRFVEWMMGLPAGWVTDIPGITHNDQLRMLGNGVVPQQAMAALSYLLAAADQAVA